jgi:hypothetical protein
LQDYGIEGPVPTDELCGFKDLTEFDLDGGALEGSIPSNFASCFPKLHEIDLSYNRLTGTIPPEIGDVSTLREFKIDHNTVTGEIPSELGRLSSASWFRLAHNQLTGSIPESFKDTSTTLYQLTLHNNLFDGNLYPLKNHKLTSVTFHNNPELCGMVPVGVRFARGFNYHNTRLGLPCPDELENGLN